jgi:hypothetical protein
MKKTTKDRKGWLIPYLIRLDEMFFNRWGYWTEVCLSNKVPEDPIPLIEFQPFHAYHAKQVHNNLKSCLDKAHTISNPLECFVDWILWGLNTGDTFPNINEEIDDYWYRTFNLGLFYVEPADHWAEFASDYLGRNNRLGFFSTPGPVTDLMVRMTFGSEPKHEHKIMSVYDPCCGTGIMLLYASNYSLNLYATDISALLVKITIINAYIYMPWMVVKPKHLSILDRAIIEIDLPFGMRIPQCTTCGIKQQSFFMDLHTDHEIKTSNTGLMTINKPTISTDLVAKKLKPENIHCAHCEKE